METAPETDTASPELVISRIFAAPRTLVFKAWTQPDEAARWWAPQGYVILSCTMDVRPGGRWRLSMRSPDCSLHTKRGVYHEIVEPERLAFTYAWEDGQGSPGHEMLVSLRFTDHGTRTRLTLHQTVFESVAARNSHRDGWTSCLQRFAGYLAHGAALSVADHPRPRGRKALAPVPAGQGAPGGRARTAGAAGGASR